MSQKTKSLFLSALTFCLGFAVIFSVTSNLSPERDPASVHQKMNALAGLSNEELQKELKRTIKITPVDNGAEKAILFEGFSSNLCQKYPEVELEFFAEGVSVAGEPTLMKIKSPCLPAQDPAEMAAIRLPVSQILAEKPRDAEFSFTGFNGKVSFQRSADEWPKTWILKKVEFKNNQNTNKVVDLKGVSSFEETPVVLEF